MKIIPVSCSFDNYSYLLVCKETATAAVIDPTEAYPVLAECDRNGVKLEAVLCTHHHSDHIGEIPEILSELKDLEVVCHVSDRPRIGVANSFVNHEDEVRVGNLRGKVLYTPGHTTGSICYLFQNALFSGDTLFGAGCGRLFEGSPEQMLGSLSLLAQACSDSTRIYFGHEYTRRNLEFALGIEPDNAEVRRRYEETLALQTTTPSTLLQEKETNPFLRSSDLKLRQAMELRLAQELPTPLELFTQLRLLRNSF